MHFYQFGEEWELYDLKTDPDELSNLYGQKKTLTLQQKLKQRLKRIRKAYDDQSDVSVRPEFIEQYRKKS
jgi:hypothetical protein